MTLVLFDLPRPEIGRITLNDPERLNAMNDAMAAEFSALLRDIEKRPLRALVLTGAGRAFSSGGDFELLEAKKRQTVTENRVQMLAFYEAFLRLRELKLPLIAAINGPAVGAGMCLAAACDIRLASAGARMGFPFTRLGLHPGMGATYLLPRIVGDAVAAELLLTGRLVTAEEAVTLGLISRVLPAEGLMEAALELAGAIAQNAPEATQQLVETLRQPPSTLPQALQREAMSQALNYGTEEFARGLETVRKRLAKD